MTHARPPPARPDWAYFLDLDGTLIELAPTPEAIRVDPGLPVLLAALLHHCEGAVALVSGRSLADLDARIDVPELPKAGQHGMERRDAAGRLWRHPAPVAAHDAVRAALKPVVGREPGLALEDKGLSLALHYRQNPAFAAEALAIARQLAAELGAGALVVEAGKCVVEIKPAGINKGLAVAEFLAEPPYLGRRPVFIGDDRSDACAFDIVDRRGGLSIGVGAAGEQAHYRLTDVTAVRSWLAGALAAAA